MAKKKGNPELIIELNERVTRLETDISWIKEKISCLDRKVWYILTGIIISILVAILGSVI